VEIKLNRVYAVITGDIVASSRLSSKNREKLHQVMVESSGFLREAFKNMIPMDVDIFRGDSWQMLISKPEFALRLALFYRAMLRAKMGLHKLDTRMAIALGQVEFVPPNSVSEGFGEAYQHSGRALESMPKAKNMCFVFPGNKLEKTLDIIVQLIDTIASRWSDKQALAVTGAIRGWKQEKIAETCWKKKISQQAVAQHLNRAGWYTVEKAVRFFNLSLKENL
jgi:hypothetical protein